MSKQRAVNTKFWSDPWVRDELNPLDRYLFLYFLTNEHTNISGVYELPLATLAFETGLDKEVIEKTMLKRLRPKVIYHKSWVIIPKFPRHQNLKSDDVIKGILREFESAPTPIREEAIHRGWGDGLGMMPGTKPNLTKPNLSVAVADAPEVVEVFEDEYDKPAKRETRTKDKLAVYALFSKNEQPWWRHKQQKIAALSLFDLVGIEKIRRGKEIMRENESDKWCPQAATPFEYEEKLPQLTRYIKKIGL